MNNIIFFDTEVGSDGKILDIGAVSMDKGSFHSLSVRDFCAFISGVKYLCGHIIPCRNLPCPLPQQEHRLHFLMMLKKACLC